MRTRAQGHKNIRIKVGFVLVPCALITFALLVIVCLAGCAQSHKIEPGQSALQQLGSPSGMAEYLKQQNLPELKSVELWQNKYGPGLKLTTPHYEVFTTLLEPLMLRAVPGFLESAYRGYNSQLSKPIETKDKFTVYLFADWQQWADFTKQFAGDKAQLFLKIRAGAYYLNGDCVTYNIGIERTFTALGHEGWHQFNCRCFKFQLPSWLDEGVAMLFEAHRMQAGTFYFEPAENTYRLDGLRKTLIRRKMIPLKELIAVDPGEILATDDTDVLTAFYSQSYALVRFLREADYEKRLYYYRRLLADGMMGNWPLDKKSKRVAIDRNLPRTVGWNRVVGRLIFQRYIGSDIDLIEREYLTFCMQIVSDIKPYTPD